MKNKSPYYTFWFFFGKDLRLKRFQINKSSVRLFVLLTLLASSLYLNYLYIKTPDSIILSLKARESVQFYKYDTLEKKLAAVKADRDQLRLFKNRIESRLDEVGNILETASNLGLLTSGQVDQLNSKSTEQGKQEGIGGPEEECLFDNCEHYHETGSALQLDSVNGVDRLVEMTDLYFDILRVLPLQKPYATGRITSGYGKRRSPFSGKISMHRGIDIPMKYRQEIFAPAAGKVVKVSYNSGYGHYVDIEHNQHVKTRYAHMSKVKVKVGDRLNYRDLVGLAGSTGRSTGTHLHYEVIVNKRQINPKKLIALGEQFNKLMLPAA